ncbi:EF-hand domain-containing protein [Rhizorhabdus sp. FW153]|uniref:hypothetical protein n=1 Tax=Rhizorhabdus sp. FW153 TaxID=3400216 RepID=UPI003CFAF990
MLTATSAAQAQQLPMTREGLDAALVQYFAGADRNGDRRIDRPEAAEALGYARTFLTTKLDLEPFVMDVAPDGSARLSVNGKGPLSTAGIMDIAYRIVDRDGDGTLSIHEIQAAGRAAFDAADRDHDGILDERERAAAVEKMTLFRKTLSAVQ